MKTYEFEVIKNDIKCVIKIESNSMIEAKWKLNLLLHGTSIIEHIN